MSEQDDVLREMAANRGCKLVKSRRRKPGGDFGRYGLMDAKSGKALFGFGAGGLTASAEEIESFLRGGAASSWKSSLGAVAAKPTPPPRRRSARSSVTKPQPARRRPIAPPRRPKPPLRSPKKAREPEPPRIREARPGDAEAISALLAQLGYEVTAADARRRIGAMRKAGEPPLVADRGGVIACLTWHVTPALHRPRPVGRITMMVVSEGERSGGVGATLVEAAETRLRDRGCGLVEVTSNMKRMRAHNFYEKLGYMRTSYRFAKTLQE